MSIVLQAAKAVRLGWYVFNGKLDKKVPLYEGNKLWKKELFFGVNTTVELQQNSKGQYIVPLNDDYYNVLTEEEAAIVAKKSRYVGSGPETAKLMDLYSQCIRWHRSAVPERRDALLKLEVPKELRQVPKGPLYRGVETSRSKIRGIKKIQSENKNSVIPLGFRGRTSSWTTDLKVAKTMAEGGEYGIVIRQTSIKASDIVVNLPDVMLRVTGSRDSVLDFDDEGEIVVKNREELFTVKAKDVVWFAPEW